MDTNQSQSVFIRGIHDLPDQNGPRLFLERLAKEQPRAHQSLLKQPALLSDVLALAAWSPLLATTIEQNPEYLHWLSRERADPRVRTTDELKEALARFALTNSSLNPQVMLARFRRRELLRTYLHDIRRSQTLVETTEELSNLADAILDYALSLARQDLGDHEGLGEARVDLDDVGDAAGAGRFDGGRRVGRDLQRRVRVGLPRDAHRDPEGQALQLHDRERQRTGDAGVVPGHYRTRAPRHGPGRARNVAKPVATRKRQCRRRCSDCRSYTFKRSSCCNPSTAARPPAIVV